MRLCFIPNTHLPAKSQGSLMSSETPAGFLATPPVQTVPASALLISLLVSKLVSSFLSPAGWWNILWISRISTCLQSALYESCGLSKPSIGCLVSVVGFPSFTHGTQTRQPIYEARGCEFCQQGIARRAKGQQVPLRVGHRCHLAPAHCRHEPH